MPSLELVDRHDQKGRGRYMEYQSTNDDGSVAASSSPNGRTGSNGRHSSKANGGGGSDLMFTVEDGRHLGSSNGNGHGHGSNGGLPPVADPTDEYFGLEQELEFRLARRRRNRYIALTALLVAFIAGVLAHNAAKDVEEGVEEVESDIRGKHHTGIGVKGKNRPSSSSSTSSSSNSNSSGVTIIEQDVSEQMDEIEALAESEASLWPTATPLPGFGICPPPLIPNIQSQRKAKLPVFHIGQFDTVPEAPSQTGANDSPIEALEESWDYALSAMDLSDDASIIAVGFSDYSGPPQSDGTINYSYSAVGMVRVFAFDCMLDRYRQVGQDLRGTNEGEQYGHRISTSSDGKTMAVSAPSESYDGGNGFVNVYYLDESGSSPRWSKLGSRIDNLDSKVSYDRIGHAISLSSSGQTVAILGVTDTNTYIVRVYKYDTVRKEWKIRGKSLTVTVNYEETYEYAPQISLSDAGDELSVSDPQFGVVRYGYKWQTAKWNRMDSKGVNFTYADDPASDGNSEWYIDGIATDRKADVIGYTAWEENYGSEDYDFQAIKLVDFSSGEAVEAYDSLWADYDVGVNVAVAQDGGVAALVVSKTDVNDDEFWADENVVGSLTVLNKAPGGDAWTVVGKGTESDGMGVPGSFVSLSGDGRIIAIGSTDVVALYGVILPKSEGGAGDHATTKDDTSASQSGATTNTDEDSTTPSKFDVCPPYTDVDTGTGPDMVLHSLPKTPDEHTIALGLSSDGSFLVIGIDSYDGEDRGLVRVYGWSCTDATYVPVGQDLFGSEEFDGFGQAVDISADGKTIVVGANQPPPGKSGYVEVYSLSEDEGDGGDSFEWVLAGHRIDELPVSVGDVGREVKISHDGTTVTFSGSILLQDGGLGYDQSFVRTVRNKKGEWKTKGDDLIGSVNFDEYGSETHISMSGDGETLAVVGSYGEFMAKVYTYNSDKKNWTEIVIPSPGASYEDLDEWEYDDDGGYGYVEWDDDAIYQFFTGRDVSLSADGKTIAVAGTAFTETEEGAMVRMLRLGDAGNWTLSTDPVDFTDDYVLSSVDVDDSGVHLAVGINSHTDGFTDQGALFVATTIADADADGLLDWSNSTGIVDGVAKNDLLGSRVAISGDGTIAAASSRKGYLTFYKTAI